MKVYTAERQERIILFFLIFIIAVIPLVYLPYMNVKSESFWLEFLYDVVLHYDNVNMPKLNLLFLALLFLLTYSLSLMRKGQLTIEYDSAYLLLGIFYLFLSLSTIFSEYKYIALFGRYKRWEGFLTYTAYIMVFFTFAIYLDKKENLILVMKTLLVSASLISFYGLLQLFKLDFIEPSPVGKKFYPRMFSTLGNPNFAGSYIIMPLTLILVLFLYSRKRGEFLSRGFLSTLFYSFLVGTSTRGCWLSFLVILALIGFLLRGKIRENIKAVIVLLLIFIIITFAMDFYQNGYISRRILSIFLDMERIVTQQDIAKVGANRLFIYRNSIPLLWKNPLFGNGLDTFAEVFPQDKYREFFNSRIIVDKAHCEYLQLGVTAGIPALLAYLCFIGHLARRGLRNWEKGDKFQQGLLMSMLAYLFQATFNISVITVAPVFWALLGMNLAINRLMEEQAGEGVKC